MTRKNRITPDPRIAFFDHHAAHWDDDLAEAQEAVRRLTELRGRLEIRSGQDVLEVGCGTGRISGWLADLARPGRLVAVDFSGKMLAKATARRLSADFKLLDICGDNRLEMQFDTILCFHAFPHFRDHLKALKNMRSMLKPAGQIVILHLAGSAELNHFHERLCEPVCHDCVPAADKWPALLAKAKLRLVSITDEPGLLLVRAVNEYASVG